MISIYPESNFAAITCTNTYESGALPACREMISLLQAKYGGPKKEVAKVDPGEVTPDRL